MCGKTSETLRAASELEGAVVRENFPEKVLRGELELARLIEVKMGVWN